MQSRLPPNHQNAVARRFGQVCAVSFATFLTSGLGLLMYLDGVDQPAWLRAIVVMAAATVIFSFFGWLIFSLASRWRSLRHAH
ncbi:MAG: hypothetical protein ACT4QA_10970 [Panacagrimonas sp.]